MTETLNDMMKESQDIVEDIPETLFILSNETRQFGAICMLYPEVLKKFCVEKMIDGVFVIPSSIHEVLLMIADKNKVDVGYIRQMIKEVNYENVSEVERLSDSPYYYDILQFLFTFECIHMTSCSVSIVLHFHSAILNVSVATS